MSSKETARAESKLPTCSYCSKLIASACRCHQCQLPSAVSPANASACCHHCQLHPPPMSFCMPLLRVRVWIASCQHPPRWHAGPTACCRSLTAIYSHCLVASCPMQPKARVKWCLGKRAGMKGERQRARGPLAMDNDCGRTSGGGKLAVNWLRWVAGSKGGTANDRRLNVPFQ